MDSTIQWIFTVCAVLLILYKYGTRNYDYWKKRGVKYAKPIPFFGNDILGFVKRRSLLEITETNYKPFVKDRFGGLFVGQVPFLTITDPDLIKQILVKDAEHFFNRYEWTGRYDPLMSTTLFSLKDEDWKKMRVVLTTVFTSAKMKDMFGFMDKCARQSVEYLAEQVSKHTKSNPTDKTGYEIEWKEFFSRYGTDVIGSTAFGYEVDSFRNPENDFYKAGMIVTNLFRGWLMLRTTFLMTFPSVGKMLGLSFFGEKYNKFFISLIENTIREREEKNIVRKDVIHILMEARKGKGVAENGELVKGKLPNLTDVDITAQSLAFFFGGFDAVGSLLGFMAYELALNPDVQETLQREIDEVFEKGNGFTYDGIMHQTEYFNMVINETLRKWPAAGITDRAVTKTYKIPKTDVSPEVILEKGTSIMVPIAGLHYDPKYFPDPHKFDPERFRDEKNSIKPFTYLPFGEGTRHCIGMRYALMETKTIMAHILKEYSFVPGKRTSIPMELDTNGPFMVTPKDGFWLAVKRRQ